MLSAETLDLLRQCWKARPPGYDATTPLQERWLFPGRKPGKPMTTRQLSRLFHEAADAAGIKKSVTLHALRHSFATHRGGAGTRRGRPCRIRLVRLLLLLGGTAGNTPPYPRSPREASHFSPVSGAQRKWKDALRRPNTRPKATVQEQFSAWVIHGTWLSPRRPSQECDPHSVNSNGPRPNRQGWKSSQFSPPTSPEWGCFGSSRRIAILRASPRSRGLSAALPKLRASRPSTKDMLTFGPRCSALIKPSPTMTTTIFRAVA